MLRKLIVNLVVAGALVTGAVGLAHAGTSQGKLTRIDAKAMMFTMNVGTKEMAFTLAKTGVVTQSGKPVKLESLKVGESAEVTYGLEEGKRVLTPTRWPCPAGKSAGRSAMA